MLLNINVKFLWKLQQRLSSKYAAKRSDMSLCFQNNLIPSVIPIIVIESK